MRKPFSGSTVASPKGALVSVGQVKTSALHIYYITKMLLCYFAVCVHFAPAAAVLRPVQAVVSGRWLPDWQHPYARPSQCVCGKSLTSVAVHEILTCFVKWNIFFSFSMMCHNPVPTTWCCLKKKRLMNSKLECRSVCVQYTLHVISILLDSRVGFTWVYSLCLPLITLTCMFYSWAVENYTAWHLSVFVPPRCRACFTV